MEIKTPIYMRKDNGSEKAKKVKFNKVGKVI